VYSVTVQWCDTVLLVTPSGGKTLTKHGEIAGRRVTATLGPDECGDHWLQVYDHGWGWTVSYRLEGQDGEPVVAELRVFPGPSPFLGCPTTDAQTPRGGLTRRGLRDRVAIDEALELVPEILEHISAHAEGLRLADLPADMAAAGIDPHDAGRGKPELWFAQLAQDYVEARRRSHRPIEDLRRLPRYRRYSVPSIRDYVHRARSKGLLSRGPGAGRAGGQLTDKARALLTAEVSRAKGRKR
jgi:hypothetical protein